ncbi:hypothetical protein TrVFT333_009859 [Trichoderma virens FT-333]|nr:hypothetical protein TrVFT333_009859 [Trichoderma virens FT-333]
MFLPFLKVASIEDGNANGKSGEQLATLLDNLASNPTVGILDGLRELERKTSLAFTLLKASVYSIVLQQEIDWGAGGEEQEAKKEEEETKEEEEEEEEEL